LKAVKASAALTHFKKHDLDGRFRATVGYQRVGEGTMRLLILAAVAISALPLAAGAFAQTTPRPAAPKIGETQNADIKTEYLESLPYKPCPARVVFPNGQHACLGLPWYPHSRVRSYDPDE
jgi:hypothetical protein